MSSNFVKGQVSPFQFGVRLNAALTQINGDGYGGFNKVGVRAGIFTERALSKKLKYQIGLNYFGKGSVNPGSEQLSFADYYQIKVRTIESLFMLAYTIKGIDINGGMSVAAVIQSNESDASGRVPETMNFNPIDLSYVAGISKMINEQLGFDLQFVNSLAPCADNLELRNYGLFGGSYHLILAFGMTYRFTRVN